MIILHRQVEKPRFTPSDRLWLILLFSHVQQWRDTLLLFKPETLLRWHRQGFRPFWTFKSRDRDGRPRLATETIRLIQRMARANRLRGAERIDGELFKLDIQVATATIREYIRRVRPPSPLSQTWSVLLNNHASEVWTCDFLQVIDLFFRQWNLFFIVELASRRVIHFTITTHPTDAWVTQQHLHRTQVHVLREATPFGRKPRFLIRACDSEYKQTCARVAAGSGIEVLKTPYRAPKANAIRERFLGCVWRECLDHRLALRERHLIHLIAEYARYSNQARPDQGIEQKTPAGNMSAEKEERKGKSIAFLILIGLHHDCQHAAWIIESHRNKRG